MAARTNRSALIAVLEKLPRAGKKILATGNGRCNLSNATAGTHPYHNASFAVHALEKYSVNTTLDFFRSLGLLTATDSEGRIYPMSNTAASVLDALRFEAERLNVEIICGTAVKGIAVQKDGSFQLSCLQNTAGIEYITEKVIIATGGKASPVHGSDGSGFALLKQLGHSITPLFPALVQITTDITYPKQLKGIRVNAAITVEINGKAASSAEGEILFTEYGLSGIAAMEVSRAASEYCSQGKKGGCFAILDLAPALSKEELAGFLKNIVKTNPCLPFEKLLFGILPSRVGQVICKASGLHDLTIETGTLDDAQLSAIIDTLKAFRLEIRGTRGFEQAQVTAGGADISEFNPFTLESKKVKGLYACGEVLDVDGGCGGFNLQWAWSSGLLAGEVRY
jgi:predicted Rossmann fold flavoprotein